MSTITLDTSFGVNGVVYDSPQDGAEQPASTLDFQKVVRTPDDRLVVFGPTYILKFQPNGVLDTSFSVDGLAGHRQGAVPVNSTITMSAGTVDSSGRILIGGSQIVRRFLPNGTIDTTFGGGLVSTVLWSIKSITPLPDGTVILSGSSGPLSAPKGTIQKLTAAGTVDTTF